MISTKITVKDHLREYCISKFAAFNENVPVEFPNNTDLYMLIWDHLSKRPINAPVDSGNLIIALPHRHGSKNPEYYNYLGKRGEKSIEQKIENMFWAEFREYIENEKQRNGTPYIESINIFMSRYGISSISEDAMIKNFYRWRMKVRKKEKRPYFRKKSLLKIPDLSRK
jgi:hypothetical protein